MNLVTDIVLFTLQRGLLSFNSYQFHLCSRNGYLETIRFLNCITMKSEREKRLFFR